MFEKAVWGSRGSLGDYSHDREEEKILVRSSASKAAGHWPSRARQLVILRTSQTWTRSSTHPLRPHATTYAGPLILSHARTAHSRDAKLISQMWARNQKCWQLSDYFMKTNHPCTNNAQTLLSPPPSRYTRHLTLSPSIEMIAPTLVCHRPCSTVIRFKWSIMSWGAGAAVMVENLNHG